MGYQQVEPGVSEMRRQNLIIFCSLIVACSALELAAQGLVGVPIPTPHVSMVGNVISIHDDWDNEMPMKDQETIRRSFIVNAAGSASKLEVDNVFGSIKVTGIAGDQIQLVVTKTIKAESKDRLDAAHKEVTLDMTQSGNSVKLYVKGPFRCNCDDCYHSHGDEGYVVHMDFELQVPLQTALNVKTINQGNIRIENVSGDYSVRNVNGSIEMLGVGGAGIAKTVNGGLKIRFRENPTANSQFASVNGSVELSFQDNLAADFRFKTFNGGVYSDFPMSALPQRPAMEEHRNGKFVFHSDRFTGGRVGSGGPEIRVENLNGDIRVLKNHV